MKDLFKGVTRNRLKPIGGGLYNVSGVFNRGKDMKQPIIDRLEELKRNNPHTAFDLTCEYLREVEHMAINAGFDAEWIAMVFDLTNVKDWVRMGLKLDHLCRLFKGRVVCVANFIKEDM